MAKLIKPNLMILAVFALLLAACSSGPEVRPDESVPEVPPPPEMPAVEYPDEIPLVPLSDDDPRGAEYRLSITAILEVPMGNFTNTFTSEWEGFFTINSEGRIEGEGTLNYLVMTYLVFTPEPNCGFEWREEGDFKFIIGGSIPPGENYIPIKILSPTLLPDNELDGPTRLCASMVDNMVLAPEMEGWETNYPEGNRDGLLDLIINAINPGFSKVLYAELPLNKEFGGASYSIKIQYLGLLLEPLVP